jgi:hypothetical protein
MFEHAAKLNFEGIISKNARAPYRSDRNEGWLKIKTVQREKFPVIGFVKDATGASRRSTSASARVVNWSIWGRLGRGGPAPSPARYGNDSTLS